MNSIESKEHYITKGLFSGKTLIVNNAPFLGGGTREVSKNSLAKKCLCKKHNELLSVYDSEAIKFGEALKLAVELYSREQDIKKQDSECYQTTICLDKFTRWFIKTYLGFCSFFKHPPHFNYKYLASLVYSEIEVAAHVKFSIEMKPLDDFTIEEIVSIAHIEKDNKIHGMEIEFYGIRLRGIFLAKPLRKAPPIRLEFLGLKNCGKYILEIKL